RSSVTDSLVTARKDNIQLIVPRDTLSPLRPRVSTQQFAVKLALDMFSIQGQLHRRASDSSNLAAYLGQPDRTFIPLTEAGVRYLPNPRFDGQEPVLLINIQQVRFWALLAAPRT